MHLKNFTLFLLLSLVFSACAEKKYDKQESVLLVFKSAVFKHNDLAFLQQNASSLKLELYSSGQAVSALTLNENSICLSFLECMSNKAFNEKVLHKAYPEHLLMNVLRGRSIFLGANKQPIRNGFTQKLSKIGKYNIDYKVFNKEIVFRDTLNNILIKVKRLE